jgi:hypothetical protein
MIDRKSEGLLLQRWMHSYEEDTETEQVFRPMGYNFPPARGRNGFEFGSDGTLLRISPGPSDRPQAERGTWELVQGDVLVLSPGKRTGKVQRAKIVDLRKDKLVLEK